MPGVGAITMRSTQWNSLTTTVLPKWYDRSKAIDVTTRGYPLLRYLMAKADMRASLPESMVIRLMDTLNDAEAYSYYDNVSTLPFRGTTAGEISFAMYSAPISMSEQEELEFTSDEAIADAIKQKTEATEVGFGRRLCIDTYAGNVTNSKRITGLEQIIYPASHLDEGDGSYDNTVEIDGAGNAPGGKHYRYRQASNTYAGITRVAWTGDEAGGTGWENLSVNWGGATAGLNKIGISSTAPYGPNGALRNLTQLLNVANYGLGGAPDVFVGSPDVINDFEFACQTKQVIYRTPGFFGDGELSFDGINFKGRMLIYDEWAKTWNSANGNATQNAPLIYGINTKTLKFIIDKRRHFNITAAKSPIDQFASVMFMQFRGQLMCVSPRNQLVAFNYNTDIVP